MEITALYAVVVSLRVVPNTTQFFQYEAVSLSCEGPGSLSDWKVKRNTSKQTNQDCPSHADGASNSTCSFDDLYEADSGVYWCESADGRLSSSVSIAVTDGSLILESPDHPVDEGEALTLRCRTSSPSFNRTRFYKDHVLIGSSRTGNLSIQRVSKSSEGNYWCQSSAAKSAVRWLSVREARHPERSPSPLAHILLPVAGACLLLIGSMLLCLWRNHKGQVDRTVSYTDVTIRQEGKPRAVCDVGAVPTFYSRVKPETS